MPPPDDEATTPTDGPESTQESHGAGHIRKTARVVPAVLRRDIRKRSQTTPFLIWISFLISFIGARLWVLTFRSVGRGDTSGVNFEVGRNVILGGYHIHHIATGIFLLAVAGWLALHYKGKIIARTSAIMFGVGLGFIVDELGFVIGGITPYRDDTQVFYIAVALAALLMSAVYAPRFWRSVRRDLRQLIGVITRVPALESSTRHVPKGEVDRQVEEVLGPPRKEDTDTDITGLPRDARTGARTVGASAAPSAARAHVNAPGHAPMEGMGAHPPATATHTTSVDAVPYRHVQTERSAVFESVTGKFIEVLILLILIGLLLGVAKLVVGMWNVVWGVSVERLFQPILVGVITLLIGVELMRAMVEYLRHSRLMLPFLVDAGILLGLREIADELFKRDPDPVLTAVLGGLLVALGGLRAILVRAVKDVNPEWPGIKRDKDE